MLNIGCLRSIHSEDMPSPPDEPSTIAIVDDDPTQRLILTAMLEGAGHATAEYASSRPLLDANLQTLGVVCLDLGLGNDSGFDVLAQLQLRDPELPVVVITGDTEIESAVAAMRAGAYDYLVKPVVKARLHAVVARALERRHLTRQVHRLSIELEHRSISTLIGDSAPMQALRRQIARVAGNPVSVCIRGETGTGKELVARAIHTMSGRGSEPFVPVNCAAIPMSLQESELFGHERGAFTGATATYRGRFEQADRGTLLLDELGEMSAATQASLLRALQDRTIRRLGSTQDIQVDVRIVSATHRDLEQDMQSGRFREDLYYRLVIFPITVPPLRERREDVPQLVGAFLKRIGADTGLAVRRISADALDALMRHGWPGNVRELQNVVHRAMLSCEHDEISLADLPADLRGATRSPSVRMPRPVSQRVPLMLPDEHDTRLPTIQLATLGPTPPLEEARAEAVVVAVPEATATTTTSSSSTTSSTTSSSSATLSMAEVEAAAIQRALRMTNGNVSLAARLLKIGRATLYRRITELSLDVATLRTDRG